MGSLFDRFRRLLEGQPTPPAAPTAPTMRRPRAPVAERTVDDTSAPALVSAAGLDSADQAKQYLERIQSKVNRLAEEFASGQINRSQFQELFDHYQRERRTVETWLLNAPNSDAWRKAAKEGQSVMIRTAHISRVLGYSIYENESGIPVNTIGQFDLDPALAVPMLSSYRTAAKEIFGAEVRSTQIEGGRWLVFVAGDFTTLMAVFSNEPAANQLKSLEDLHRLFEKANRHLLQAPPLNPDILVFPHVSSLGYLA
jgi:hypothetical protein